MSGDNRLLEFGFRLAGAFQLGVNELKLLDCRQLWEIGSALVTEDPRIIIA